MGFKMKPLTRVFAHAVGATALTGLSAYFAIHSYHMVRDMAVPFSEIPDPYVKRQIIWTCLGRTDAYDAITTRYEDVAARGKNGKESVAENATSELGDQDKESLHKCAENALLNHQIVGREKLTELILPLLCLSWAGISLRRSFLAYREHKAEKLRADALKRTNDEGGMSP